MMERVFLFVLWVSLTLSIGLFLFSFYSGIDFFWSMTSSGMLRCLVNANVIGLGTSLAFKLHERGTKNG